MRLIDADALIKRCMNGIDNEFIGIVNEIPTVKVLDKIRAEIDGIEINGQVDRHTSFIRTGDHVKQMALDIIDKYRKGVGE